MFSRIRAKVLTARKPGSRWSWSLLTGAGVALLALALSASSASAHVDPGTYTGNIETSGACGGGTISVTTDADGANVASITITGLLAEDSEGVPKTLTGTANFPADVVPISDADDSFSAYFEVLASEIQMAGTFDEAGNLTGGIDITPGTCGTVGYSAVAAATALPTALPSTGTGSSPSSGSGQSWGILGIAIALLGASAVTLVGVRRATGHE